MKVLIAEDDLTSRILLEGVVSQWGFDVVLAVDGPSARAAFQDPEPPGIALLDWNMPGEDGVEVCRQVRAIALEPSPYLIILTARNTKQDVVNGLDAGANDYIVKPFDNPELRARLEVGRRMVDLQRTLADRLHDLQDAMTRIKTLQGLLRICCFCHRIQTDEADWQRIENYISEHSDAEFSHGICPECMKKNYPEYCGADQPPAMKD